jgi:hypothetical protein
VAIRAALLALVLCFALAAQRPRTRSKAGDYPAHSKLANVEIGAEFLPGGIPGGKGGLGSDYLVVEVGVFPAGKSVSISKSQFTLRVDGSKSALTALSPGSASVAGVQSGSKDGSIVLGGPPLKSRFPEDNRDSSGMPRRPIALESEPSGGSESGAGFPEGSLSKPTAAYLLFHFDGNAKSIRSLELDYDNGKLKLRLL